MERRVRKQKAHQLGRQIGDPAALRMTLGVDLGQIDRRHIRQPAALRGGAPSQKRPQRVPETVDRRRLVAPVDGLDPTAPFVPRDPRQRAGSELPVGLDQDLEVERPQVFAFAANAVAVLVES
jgi:hypothetical protein